MVDNLLKKLKKMMLSRQSADAYQLSAADRQDADSAAVLSVLKVMIGVQVKTIYGLDYRHVGAHLKEQAAKYSASAEGSQSLGKKDRAQLLHMSGVLSALADEMVFESAKAGSEKGMKSGG